MIQYKDVIASVRNDETYYIYLLFVYTHLLILELTV